MALAFLRLIFRLLMVLVVFQGVCVMFYYTRNTHSPRDGATDVLQQLRCTKLRHKFTVIKPAKSIQLQSFTQELSDFMSCPYKSNTTERELNRMRLQFCCNATGSLFLTKQNTAINQSIPYETSTVKTYKMNAGVHRMLPEICPLTVIQPAKPVKPYKV